jgi:hypothetical protein
MSWAALRGFVLTNALVATELSTSIDWPETLVLYRMRPISLAQVGSGCRAGRVRYSCLKEAARGEAVMQIQWCRLDEKGIGEKSWSEQAGREIGLVVVCGW